MGTILQVIFYQPTINLMMIFYRFIGENLGIAIILLAIFSRIISIPMTKRQIKMGKKNKEFQAKYAKIKKKYAKNKEKQTEELSKLQMKHMPGQIIGCFPLIIMLIFLVQVRNGVRNLVAQGVYAYNKVAYVESFKYPEDSIKFTPDEDLEYGVQHVRVEAEASDGETIQKEIVFAIAENESKKEELEEQYKEELKKVEEEENGYNSSNIGVYVATFEDGAILLERRPEFYILLRPPSGQTIITDSVKVSIEDVDYTQRAEITSGVGINMDFLKMDLSKVAADFSWSEPTVIAPYVFLAVLVGVSQFLSTKMMTGIREVKKGEKSTKQTLRQASFDKARDKQDKKKQKKEKEKKKKKKKDEEPSMEDMMGMMNKQMVFLFPIITIVMSLGYWGGSSVFPAAISLFWTVQTFFVIIQQILGNREEFSKWIAEKFKIKINA